MISYLVNTIQKLEGDGLRASEAAAQIRDSTFKEVPTRHFQTMRVTRISEVDEKLEFDAKVQKPEPNVVVEDLDSVDAQITALKKKLGALQTKKEEMIREQNNSSVDYSARSPADMDKSMVEE